MRVIDLSDQPPSIRTRIALQLARMLARLPSNLATTAKSILELVEHTPSWPQSGVVGYPEGVEKFDLFHVQVIDLYFTEHFQRLRRGLRVLKDTLGREDLVPRQWETFERWFERREMGIGGWSNVGVINLQGSRFGHSLDRAWICAYGIGASSVCLSLMVRPAAAIRSELKRILDCETHRRLEIHLDKVGSRRSWHGREWLPDQLRRMSVRALLNRINVEVVRLLRDYLGTGWSAEKGPLPMLVTYTRELSPTYDASTASRHDLWRIFDVPVWDPFRYEADGATLFWDVDRYDDDAEAPTQATLLIDLPAFLATKDLKGYINQETALEMTVQARFGRLAISLALDDALRRTAGKVRLSRRELAPLLTPGTRHNVRTSSRFQIARRIETTAFETARLAAECDPHRLARIVLRPETVDLHRAERDADGAGDFVTDWESGFKAGLDNVSSALAVLREALTTSLNLRLQRVTLWLTVVAIALTCIGTWLAVPVALREGMVQWLLNWLR